MGGGCYRSQGRAAQNVLLAAVVEQIGEVGGTSAELLNGERIFGPWQLAAQEICNRTFIKFLIGANADCI